MAESRRREIERTGPLGAAQLESARRGGALVLVILLLLAITALGHGAFVVAVEEDAASRASAALTQARLMAEGGVRRTLRDLTEDTLPSVALAPVPLADQLFGDAHFRVDLWALSREVFWVEGEGAAALVAGGPRRVEVSVGRLLWALSPLARVAAFPAAVEYGAGLEAATGSLDGIDADDTRGLDAPLGCWNRRAPLDSALAGRRLAGAVEARFVTPSGVPELGLVVHDSLLARVAPRVIGVVSPAPVSDGGLCDTGAALNWGSPSDSLGPCGGHRPMIVSEGSLTLEGGEGQGVLIVDGDLRFRAGARYAGIVLVSGDLILDGGALLQGLARVRGSVRLAAGSRLSGARCPALLALEAGERLRRPLQVPGGGWIRPL